MYAKKVILLFTDWYIPGYKAGGPIRSCRNLVEAFASEYAFYIVTSDRDLGDQEPYENIKTNTWTQLSASEYVYYAKPGSLSRNTIRTLIEDARPQVVYLNSMFSPDYTLRPLWILWQMKNAPRTVLAPRGMLKDSGLQQKKWKKKAFLAVARLAGLNKKLVFHATDEQEKMEILRQFGPGAEVVIANNLPVAPSSLVSRTKTPANLRIVFLSRIHPIKNLLYALDVLAQLPVRSGIVFDIYGAIADEKYYARCFEAAKKLENKAVVQFMGEVEHGEVADIMANYHVFFLPTRGENFGHAIFEALANGCPVVISDQTPWKDLEANGAGWALSLSEPGKFSDVLERLYHMNQEEFDELSSRAFAYASQHAQEFTRRENYIELFEGS
jgi:glycosyltransferase involved in cell wall biosynthesis